MNCLKRGADVIDASAYTSNLCVTLAKPVLEELRPQLDLTEKSVKRVVEVVNDARFDRRKDEPDSGLRVDEAIAAVEEATRDWSAVTDEPEAALDAVLARPDSVGDSGLPVSAHAVAHGGDE